MELSGWVWAGIVNLSTCTSQGINFTQNYTHWTLGTLNVMVVGFVCKSGRIAVNPTKHVAPQQTANVWFSPIRFWQHPLIREFAEKKFKLWANCCDDLFQVWYVCWATLRAPTGSDFWISSLWRKCLPNEIEVLQVTQESWRTDWVIFWSVLGKPLECPLSLLMCLIDRQEKFVCSLQ